MFLGGLFFRLLRMILGLGGARPVRALILIFGHYSSIVLRTLYGKPCLFLIDGNVPPPQSDRV